jgi:hypothetical protein
MRASETINELAAALSKVQGEVQSAHKDSSNPFFKSKYADLTSVYDACRGPLAKHGLSIVQMPRAEGNVVTVETRLLHSSGQWVEGELTAVAKDGGPQSVGSIITYLRRYSRQSSIGIAAEDDDGNAAQSPQLTELLRLIDALKVPSETIASWLQKAKKKTLADMPADTIAKCITYLQNQQTATLQKENE